MQRYYKLGMALWMDWCRPVPFTKQTSSGWLITGHAPCNGP